MVITGPNTRRALKMYYIVSDWDFHEAVLKEQFTKSQVQGEMVKKQLQSNSFN